MVQHVFASSPETVSFIIDGEIVAVDAKDGSLKSFQELSNRARKAVELHEVTITVCLFAFDLMYLDGKVRWLFLVVHTSSIALILLQTLLEVPFRQRRQMLRSRFPPIALDQPGSARFDHVESVECSGSDADKEAVEEFWIRAVESRCEGLMIKVNDIHDYPDDRADRRPTQVLDSGEIVEVSGPRSEKTRRKPLPATYEPGNPDLLTCCRSFTDL